MSRSAQCLLLLPFALGLAACRGPDPAVIGQELKPPGSEGAPYEATIAVENKGGGEGQIEVTARLRARATGGTAAQCSRMVDLMPHEKLDVMIELRPALPAPYDLSVEAKYPPP